MLDFLMVSTRTRNKKVEIFPKFIIKKSNDLMIRGGDFYAVWLEDKGMWSTDEQDALYLIDQELKKRGEDYLDKHGEEAKVLYMWDASSGMIDTWHKYCQKQMRDSFHPLDEKLIFSNTKTTKRDYASKRLSYPLEEGDTSSYDELMSTLYSEEERHKIEWAIGSVVAGDSIKIQKFLVLYGSAGTGKSTVLNIIQQLFDGYYSVFDARALGSSSNSFALESFKSNPLVAIQHDGDLSRIEDNTRLNSLVSHELMTVNEKFKSTYSNRFNSFLFMGTNKPVKITDAKSGLMRRLIDVSPTGNKIPPKEYKKLVKQIGFETGAIAYHCLQVYLDDPGYFDDYVPMSMLGASNDFYNFMLDSYFIFKEEDGTTLKAAWEMYKNYCDDAKVMYPYSQRPFKEELKNYFNEYKDRVQSQDGTRVRSYYSGFRLEKFENDISEPKKSSVSKTEKTWLKFDKTKSLFDDICSDCPAQYATTNGTPTKKWSNVDTTLNDISTTELHYVKVPENHIVIDFDIRDDSGNKNYERNLEEASKWPPTYAELSKSEAGIHLHYIYNGDVKKLCSVYDDNIEIKVFTGNSSLRRKLTKCNDISIATISSGLPTKGEDKVVNFDAVKSEKALRTLVKRNLNKEYHGSTKPSVDFIYKILEDAYSSGVTYDISDLRNQVLVFAANSTNQSDYCIKLVDKMKFRSEEAPENTLESEKGIVFYDIEVFPNLFIVCWKYQGKKNIVRMINPTAKEVEQLMTFKLVGFNCRRYDNHILYARLLGYSVEELYSLSQKIINGLPGAFFMEAYNISYTDVLDFASAGHKQSLKKFEIELGIHHQELGLPWDEPVPKEMWNKVAEYCDNDVIATEATFDYLSADWTARKILADIAGMSVNDTTNSLTTRIIFGKERHPQSQFNYRDLSDTSDAIPFDICEGMGPFDEYTLFDSKKRPIFPGYSYDHGVSIYRDEKVGEGGYVYAEPGMYTNVALLDVASMHPHSIIAENLFGDIYTQRFKDLVNARIYIKHGEFDKAKKLLDGKLAKYLTDESMAKTLSTVLKTPINSVYGLTAASFDNPFLDPRNKDNIVAKRGALFMINLKYEVQKRGFQVVHIKTDSIKIPNASNDIIQFCMDYGKMYGYVFEHEATYEKMCLVNNAVYICKNNGKWEATGAQFQVPYVFKTLFSKEPIKFEDLCETKSVTSALYLDMNERLPDGSHDYRFVGKVGQFCPMKPGCGGGDLVREGTDKNGNKIFSFVTGSKGYKWMESEMVKLLNKENDIDRSYYTKLVDEAIYGKGSGKSRTVGIEDFGDYEWFTE